MILDTFLEMGGSRNMRVNSSDIEVKLVNDLKLEEHLYMDYFKDNDIRRRRNISTKKRPGTGRKADQHLSRGGNVIEGGPRQPTHSEDDVINQVHNPRSRWECSTANQGEMMEIQMWDSRAPMKLEPSSPHRLLNEAGSRGVYQGSA